MYLAGNIKLLRKRRSRTQDDVAFALNMKRSTLSGYENRVAEPGAEALIALSQYYKISIGTLLKVDLSKLRPSELSQLERGYDMFYSGETLRVLATTIDSKNEENIELVNEKATAGYTTGFADPEKDTAYISVAFSFKTKEIPYLQISGDSMLPP